MVGGVIHHALVPLRWGEDDHVALPEAVVLALYFGVSAAADEIDQHHLLWVHCITENSG